MTSEQVCAVTCASLGRREDMTEEELRHAQSVIQQLAGLMF